MGGLGRTLLTPEIRIFIFSPGDNGISQLKTTFLQPNDGVMSATILSLVVSGPVTRPNYW